ncbi:MAG: transglycosylase SLT domain-containing protein [Gammaproteobacteria bacterium]|nr:transglycosylase SLT domain-containing protein [Gammaproteobacteria bacterium]
MQNNINRHEQEKLETDLKLLNLRLATAEAEFDKIQQELLAMEPSQTSAASKNPKSGFTVATASVVAVIALSFIGVYHDALSNVKQNSQYEESAMRELLDRPIVPNEYQASNRKLTSSRPARVKKATKQQWGPSLLMPETADKKRHSVFHPTVKEQQKNLLTLGFDVGKADGYKGARTRRAITEFRSLYLPDSGKLLKDDDLAIVIANYAELARKDAARFGIDHGIVAAIRLSSIRTGVDFSYLMKLAAAESNFKPKSKSATSSATGIYQFTRDTWLNTLKTHGAKYGLIGEYAVNIEHYETIYGYQRPRVRDEALYKHLLELRKNPRVSAIMAAEMVRDSEQLLANSFDRKPTQTDLYLTHFLGNNAAITFLQSLQQSPDVHAVELFPEAANSNQSIFHPRSSGPRTVDEVYALFDAKFSTRRYDDSAAN